MNNYNVMYLTYDGVCSAMSFPNTVMAHEWFASTQQLKDEMQSICATAAATSANAEIPRVVAWLRRYVNEYLSRWGSDMVAVDVRRSAENSSAALPEDRRVDIPSNVTGTAVGCSRTVLTTIEELNSSHPRG